MIERSIKLVGQSAHGARVSAGALREALKLLVDGCQRALRMRAEGRSAARGPVPSWIVRSTAFEVELRAGSTLLAVHTPTLKEADPEQFRQATLLGDLDPSLTAVDYLSNSLDAALGNSVDPWAFDRSMLAALRRDLKDLFGEGITMFAIPLVAPGAGEVHVSPGDLSRLSRLERQIPPEQAVRVAGKLDTIRHSDVTFALFVGDSTDALRGVSDRQQVARLQGLWGKRVVVTGIAHFTPEGGIQLLEAESIEPASATDLAIWGARPQSFERIQEGTGSLPVAHESTAHLRVAQGPRSGVNAIFGQWPGDESDEEVERAVEALS